MKVKTRPLNKGETFLCSFKRAKELFKDTSVMLNFAYTNRMYGTFARTPQAFYLKNNIKGAVIAHMGMYPRETEPLLSLFVQKKENISPKLQEEFETKYLPQFYDFYQRYFNDTSLNNQAISMLVELFEGTLKVHFVKH